MNSTYLLAACGVTIALFANAALAGPLDPNCTPEKAAKSPAAKDSGKKAAGVDEKGPIEKQKHKNDTPVEKAKDTVSKWFSVRPKWSRA
jgi:hypothetical protein